MESTQTQRYRLTLPAIHERNSCQHHTKTCSNKSHCELCRVFIFSTSLISIFIMSFRLQSSEVLFNNSFEQAIKNCLSSDEWVCHKPSLQLFGQCLIRPCKTAPSCHIKLCIQQITNNLNRANNTSSRHTCISHQQLKAHNHCNMIISTSFSLTVLSSYQRQ